VALSRRKDDFLAMLGHELRNSLSAMVAAAALLDKASVSRDSLMNYGLDVLHRQVGQLTRIVDDLNDLSRVGHGKLDLRLQRVELATLVADCVNTALPGIKRRRQHLIVSVPPETVELHADPVRMAQVLANLLDNAAKYTPDEGEIRLTASVRDGEVHLSVRDNGIGIPSEKLGGIFRPFEQGRPAGGHRDGLGLGLALDRPARHHAWRHRRRVQRWPRQGQRVHRSSRCPTAGLLKRRRWRSLLSSRHARLHPSPYAMDHPPVDETCTASQTVGAASSVHSTRCRTWARRRR
jgi:K+-sensing histidine kinase KdpD